MKVTTKGQVTIPARIREFLDITPHSEVDFRIAGGMVILVKPDAGGSGKDRFSSMRGTLKGGLTTREWMRRTRGS